MELVSRSPCWEIGVQSYEGSFVTGWSMPQKYSTADTQDIDPPGPNLHCGERWPRGHSPALTCCPHPAYPRGTLQAEQRGQKMKEAILTYGEACEHLANAAGWLGEYWGAEVSDKEPLRVDCSQRYSLPSPGLSGCLSSLSLELDLNDYKINIHNAYAPISTCTTPPTSHTYTTHTYPYTLPACTLYIISTHYTLSCIYTIYKHAIHTHTTFP